MRKVIIGFTCGTFDLCHYGHVLMLKECKNYCDYLMVGIQTDPTIDRVYKNKPIQSIEERKGQIAAIKYVDQVYLYDTEVDLIALLNRTMPHVRMVGADWKGKSFTGDNIKGIKTIFNSRSHNFSTSELRKRIYHEEAVKQLQLKIKNK